MVFVVTSSNVHLEQLLVPVSTSNYKQLSSGCSVELEHMFYYVPCPLIDQTPEDDGTSLTTYTMHSHICDTHTHTHTHTHIYIYIVEPIAKQS